MDINNRQDICRHSDDADVKFRPRSNKDWDERRLVIEQLYCVEDYGLRKVMEVMREQNFYATEKQYKRQFKRWEITKNIKDPEYQFMIRVQEKRRLQGKRTHFTLRGRSVPQAKIVRHAKRLIGGLEKEDFLCSHIVATPPDISYDTPTNAMASPQCNDQDSPKLPAACVQWAEKSETPEGLEIRCVLPLQESARETQWRQNSTTGTQKGIDGALGLDEQGPSREQLQRAADLAFIMTDSARAFELYHKLYTSICPSSAATYSKEFLVTALIRSVQNLETAQKAKEILFDHYGTAGCHTKPWLEIWLDFVVGKFDRDRVESVLEDIGGVDGDINQYSNRGPTFDLVLYQALHFAVRIYSSSHTSSTSSTSEQPRTFEPASLFASDHAYDRLHCIRACIKWCMKQLDSEGWSCFTDLLPVPTLPPGTIQKEETLFNVFYRLWNSWQQSSLDQLSDLTWALEAEEELNISATELLLIVSDMIIEDTEAQHIGYDIFKRDCLTRARYLNSVDDPPLHHILVAKLVDGRLYRGINRTRHTLPDEISNGLCINRPLCDYVREHAGRVLGVPFKPTLSLNNTHLGEISVPNPSPVSGEVKLRRYYLPSLHLPSIEAATGDKPANPSGDMSSESSKDRQLLQPEHTVKTPELITVRSLEDITLLSTLGSSSMSYKDLQLHALPF